jgi:hypothetical protein
MKKRIFSVLTIVFLVTALIPALASSADHPKNEDMKHEGMHEGMMMGESMVVLGQSEVSGVNGMAHLSDVSKQMAALGRSETNHFMMMFSDVKTGKAIEKGVVALKVKSPSGETSGPFKLIGMGGHFGADVILTEKGEYHFIVGTKLGDGVKRQYHFDYTAK